VSIRSLLLGSVPLWWWQSRPSPHDAKYHGTVVVTGHLPSAQCHPLPSKVHPLVHTAVTAGLAVGGPAIIMKELSHFHATCQLGGPLYPPPPCSHLKSAITVVMCGTDTCH
jgi:hypothetical protein